MRNNELAFTSFESMASPITGNWQFGAAVPVYSTFNIKSATNNIAIVEASPTQLTGVQVGDIFVKQVLKGISWNGATTTTLKNTFLNDSIYCITSHPTDPNLSIIAVKSSPGFGNWSGTLRVKTQLSSSTAVIDSYAHSGKSSLKVATTDATFRQYLLSLSGSKSYLFSCWASINGLAATAPNVFSTNNVGVAVKLYDRSSGTLLNTFNFLPTGPIIDGWQQISGTVNVTTANPRVDLIFQHGTSSGSTAWYDDVRLHSAAGNMKSYVYNMTDFKLAAILDENNFASWYYYDKEGNLYLTKKETKDGVKTILENITVQYEKQ